METQDASTTLANTIYTYDFFKCNPTAYESGNIDHAITVGEGYRHEDRGRFIDGENHRTTRSVCEGLIYHGRWDEVVKLVHEYGTVAIDTPSYFISLYKSGGMELVEKEARYYRHFPRAMAFFVSYLHDIRRSSTVENASVRNVSVMLKSITSETTILHPKVVALTWSADTFCTFMSNDTGSIDEDHPSIFRRFSYYVGARGDKEFFRAVNTMIATNISEVMMGATAAGRVDFLDFLNEHYNIQAMQEDMSFGCLKVYKPLTFPDMPIGHGCMADDDSSDISATIKQFVKNSALTTLSTIMDLLNHGCVYGASLLSGGKFILSGHFRGHHHADSLMYVLEKKAGSSYGPYKPEHDDDMDYVGLDGDVPLRYFDDVHRARIEAYLWKEGSASDVDDFYSSVGDRLFIDEDRCISIHDFIDVILPRPQGVHVMNAYVDVAIITSGE